MSKSTYYIKYKKYKNLYKNTKGGSNVITNSLGFQYQCEDERIRQVAIQKEQSRLLPMCDPSCNQQTLINQNARDLSCVNHGMKTYWCNGGEGNAIICQNTGEGHYNRAS